MANVRMKKMRVIGLSSEKEAVLDTLNKSGSVELKNTDEIENTHTRLNTKRLNETNSKIAKLSNAITFLNEQKLEREKFAKKGIVKYTPPKKPFFAVRKDVSFDEFITSAKTEYEVFAIIDALNELAEKMTANKSYETSANTEINTLLAFDKIDVPLNEIKPTKNVDMSVGILPSLSKEKFEEISKIDEAYIEIIEENGSNMTVFIICHKSVSNKVTEILNDCGYVKNNIDCNVTCNERKNQLLKLIEESKEKAITLNGEAMEYYPSKENLELLFDYYSYKKIKIEAQGNFRRTEKELAVEFEAWVPESRTNEVQKLLEETTSHIFIEFEDPKENELPPTLTNNGPVVKAFESVTNMYSPTNYRESDPSFSVMIFFFLFFGFMLSDAGYGLLLAIVGFILWKFVKLEPGTKNMVIIITLGGISTIIWGILFGGFFSIEIKGTFLEKLCWFSPLDNPLGVLGLSLGIGVIQILYGLALKARELIKHHQGLDALFDVGPWYLIFIGALLFALSLVDGFASFKSIGLYVALAGAVALVLTQGRHEKNIFKKLFKGVASLYGIVNYVSDILSYARLFGLGLATGVVGMVFNKIAGVFIGLLGPIAGGLVGVIFILVGHTMNIGINVLGAYVHDCRLQYIEFFSKFYEGGGHIFVPLGSKTKYVKVN